MIEMFMNYKISNCISCVKKNYLYLSYSFFVGMFFILSTRQHRNFYYILVLIPFFLSMYRNNMTFYKSKILVLASAFILFNLCSLFWADGVSIEDSLNMIRKGFLLITFICVTVHVFSGNSVLIKNFFNIVCCLAAIFALVSIYVFKNVDSRLICIGTLDGPIPAGSCYAVVVLISIYSCVTSSSVSFYNRMAGIFVATISVLFLLLTQSRGPLLAMILSLVPLIFLKQRKKLLLVFLCFVLPVVGLYALKVIGISTFISRLDSFRLTIWRQSYDLFLSKPWLGYGILGSRPEIVFNNSDIALHPHNIFLSVMLDSGVIGLLLLVLLIGSVFYLAIKIYAQTSEMIFLSLIFFAVLTNITDGRSLINSPNYQWFYFWLPIGLVASFELIHKPRSREDFSSP